MLRKKKTRLCNGLSGRYYDTWLSGLSIFDTAYALSNVGFTELRKLYVESNIKSCCFHVLTFSVIHLIIYWSDYDLKL